MINEVAWAGTIASAHDEWVELRNLAAVSLDLAGWHLTDGGDIDVELAGTIPPEGFFLLERTDDSTVASRAADWVYTGALSNAGESLQLFDPSGQLVDSANREGGSWPAGSAAERRSMERRGLADHPSNWQTFAGLSQDLDADGHNLLGSPGRSNSSPAPVPTPTPTGTPGPAPTPTAIAPGRILLNEIAWAGTLASASDEWIELHNPALTTIELAGWTLRDGGDIEVPLTGTIAGDGYFLLERTDDSTVASLPADLIYTGSLRNSGERLQLFDPAGNVVSSANPSGQEWPAGEASSRRTMERAGADEQWVTFFGPTVAFDAAGNGILGTPREANSALRHPPTATPTPTATIAPVSRGALLINEVGWAGTEASPSDEWIELYNPGSNPLDLTGWRLTDSGDVDIPLKGTVEPGAFFLLERTDDSTLSHRAADQIYVGTLSNRGERLRLIGPTGGIVDQANADGGGWPAGRAEDHASMERQGGTQLSARWGTFTGYRGIGRDAEGRPIQGSPGGPNSILFPTPVPSPVPGEIVINEVLIRPHYDWEGTGGVTTDDEFIELYNRGPGSVQLRGWWLDDIEEGGSRPFDLGGIILSAGGQVALFRSTTGIALNDGGDQVRLMTPNGRLVDQIGYLRVRAYNLSYGRLPNGSDEFSYGLWPTPGEPNLLFEEPANRNEPPAGFACSSGENLEARLPRYGRWPGQLRFLFELGLGYCLPLASAR